MMNDSHPSIKKIVDVILALEKKNNLLEWKINDVFVWQSARVNIYISLMDMIIPHNAYQKKKTFIRKLKIYYQRIIINSLFYNPYLDFNKSEALVFDSGRKYLVDDIYIDIYTKYLCEEFEQEKISYKKYDTNYLVDDLAPRSLKVKHLDFIYIAAKLLSKFIKVTISENDVKKLKFIESEINSSLRERIDLKTIFINEIKRFKSQYPFYKLLWQLKKSKRIYLINSTDKAPLIKAAKDNNVIVNELQHGLIVKEGLIANFPDTIEDSLEYFPNKFLVWEDLNMCTSKLPLSNTNIVKIKNKHLQHMLKKNQNITRKDKQILIVSQPYSSEEIKKFVMNNIKEMQSWQFVYKLHPAEDHDFFADTAICQLSIYKNLTIVTNERSIYRLFSESKYVVGVFSTAVFEAPYFGCKILLLNLPGVEMAYSLIENNKAMLVNINDRLARLL